MLDNDDAPIINKVEDIMETVIPLFPFFWLNIHFVQNGKNLVNRLKNLSVPKASNWISLWHFILSLKAKVVDLDHNISVEERLIET